MERLCVFANQALSNMREILAAAGAAPSDVVKTMILLEDISDFAEVNTMYKEFFGEGRVPARYACGSIAAVLVDSTLLKDSVHLLIVCPFCFSLLNKVHVRSQVPSEGCKGRN
mmetsp:Transcript_18992/g.76210  ORF Transcript_18992/g.76210 Transcript_18992/m.76210 type:complete len:113 (-) Transcript_18992:929-1267(-)